MNIKLSFYFVLMSYTALAGVDDAINKSVFANKINHCFEENLGQINYPDNKPAPEVKYVFKQGNLKIFLLKNGLAYQLEKYLTPTLSIGEGGVEPQLPVSASADSGSFSNLETYRMDMELIGANPNPEIIAEGKSQDYTNYYNADLIQTHSYQKIIYKNIYPSIDWVIYLAKDIETEEPKNDNSTLKINHSKLFKYDFIVHPGADPALIKLKYKNAEQIYLDQFGNLILRNRLGDIKENTPIAFQNQAKIIAKYILTDSIVRFQTDKYDKSQNLIIDPKLEWSTYYGGNLIDALGDCAIDSKGMIYGIGASYSSSNIYYQGYQSSIASGSSFSAILVKFSPQGQRIWATYYGGNFGLVKLKLFADSILYTYANVSATSNIQAFNGFQMSFGGGSSAPADGAVFRFDTNGYRIWATFYGGNNIDNIGDLDSDSKGNLYLFGATSSPNLAFNAHQSVLVKYNNSISTGLDSGNHYLVKFNPLGHRIWSTYLGAAGINTNLTIGINKLDQIFVLSSYRDTAFLFRFNHPPACTTKLRSFLAKLDTNGVLLDCNCVLLDTMVFARRMKIDHENNIIIVGAGIANGLGVNGFKDTLSGFADAYIIKIDTAAKIKWATYYGGNQAENFIGIDIDRKNNIYVAGITSSTSGSIGYRGMKMTYQGGTFDGLIVKFRPNGQRIYGSYWGGSLTDGISSIRLYNDNTIYLTGNTRSTSGISYNGHQNAYGGGTADDGFLTKYICSSDTILYDTICRGDTFMFNGQKILLAGSYKDTLDNWEYCDSFITLYLTVLRRDTTTLYDTICSGARYVWNGQNRTSSGVYRDTLVNKVGCDSFLILNLHIKRTDTAQVYDTLCHNLPKTFNGQNLTLAGIYRDTLKNIAGCDSHIFYHFMPKPVYETPLSRAICAGDSSLFSGKYRKLAGVYYDTLKSKRNCDSVLKLTLTINPLDTNRQTQSICRGKSYNFYSQVLTSQGTYSHKFTNRSGCDSLILMTISVIDSSTYSFSRMLCSGQSFPFNNQNLTQAGVYRDTFTNYLGCDSFVTLNLSFGLVLYDTLRQTVCAGQAFRGYSSPGIHYETYKSSLGCDSILTIYLKHLPATEYKTISHSKCGAFIYGARTYTQNDSFTETIKNYLNCDSIVTKYLIFITEPQPKFLADKTIEFCEEILHIGQLKTTSFFTHDTIKSQEYPYCDSLYQPIFYRRESRPILRAITKQIDTVIKGETASIRVSGAQNYRWSTGEQSPSIRPQITEDKIFEVAAWNLADCEEKMQFSIYAIDQPLIDFPTAFSPNGDGLNDYFAPNTNGNITIDYFQIFNRWGEKVYEYSTLSKGWDGSYLGKPAANGLYTYTLRYTYLGRYFTRSGEVMVF